MPWPIQTQRPKRSARRAADLERHARAEEQHPAQRHAPSGRREEAPPREPRHQQRVLRRDHAVADPEADDRQRPGAARRRLAAGASTSGFVSDLLTPRRKIISRLGRVATPVLYHIEVSHYNEKARWALDYKGVPHRRKAPMPMMHMAWATGDDARQGQDVPDPAPERRDDRGLDAASSSGWSATTRSRRCIRRIPTTAAARSGWRSSSTRSSRPHIRQGGIRGGDPRPGRVRVGRRPKAGKAPARRLQGHGCAGGPAGAGALRDQRRHRARGPRARRPPRSTGSSPRSGRAAISSGDALHRRGPDRGRAVLPARAPAGVRAPDARPAARDAPADAGRSSWGAPAWEWVREMYRRHRGTSAAVAAVC